MFFDTLYMPAPIGLYYKMVWCSSIFMLYIVLCYYLSFTTKFHYELLRNTFLQFVTTICYYFFMASLNRFKERNGVKGC